MWSGQVWVVVKKGRRHIEEEEWPVTLSVPQLHSFSCTFAFSNRNRRLRVTDLYVPPHSCGVKAQKDFRGGARKRCGLPHGSQCNPHSCTEVGYSWATRPRLALLKVRLQVVGPQNLRRLVNGCTRRALYQSCAITVVISRQVTVKNPFTKTEPYCPIRTVKKRSCRSSGFSNPSANGHGRRRPRKDKQ